MQKRNVSFLVGLFVCVLALHGYAASRIAIIAEKDAQPLADLLITELSADKNIVLLERDELSKIGDERKVQQLAGKDAVELGKLLRADGLVFLRKDAANTQVRLTAVNLGYALFDDRVSPELDLPQQSKSIAHQVTEYAPKLQQVPNQLTSVSVLNLRSSYPSSNSEKLERNLTLLLESRLASNQKYVVLERRHAWSLGFERSLSTAPTPLLQGAYVIDGTFDPPAKDSDKILVHLRLRTPEGRQTAFEIKGLTNDLAALAEKIMMEIQKITGVISETSAWQPQNEAREYLLEGIWAYQHDACDEAIEALDSAELLGERAPDLYASRIPALSTKAAGSVKLVRDVSPDIREMPPDFSPDARIDAAKRAIEDFMLYQKQGMESQLQIFDHFHTGEGRTYVLRKIVSRGASKLLIMLDKTNNSRADELRAALRLLHNYDPLHGNIPRDGDIAINYAGAWSLSLDEEIAYYKLLCTTNPSVASGAFKLRWAVTPKNFGERFLHTAGKRREAYMKFYRSLLEDSAGKPIGLLCLAQESDPADKNEACNAYYENLWTDREELHREGRLVFLLNYAFKLEQSKKVEVADARLIKLLHFYLQRGNYTGATEGVWCPELFPPKEAPSLWQELQVFEKKVLEKENVHIFPRMKDLYINRFGNPDAEKSKPPDLVVKKFWHPADLPAYLIFDQKAIVSTPNGIWVAGRLNQTPTQVIIYHINPETFETTAIPTSLDVYPQQILTTEKALYVLCRRRDDFANTIIAKYDFVLQKWNRHEIPETHEFYETNGNFYLVLKHYNEGNDESGIARYDERTGNTTLLASSRRRPAQNQFDDTRPYRVNSIFTAPEGKPCALIDGGCYFINEKAGTWMPFAEAGVLQGATTAKERTLLYGYSMPPHGNGANIAVMVNSEKLEPALWLGFPNALRRKGFPEAEKTPLMELPEWAKKQPRWQGMSQYHCDKYYFRGEDLFSLYAQPSGIKELALIWYSHGRAKPVRIPLIFEMNAEDTNDLKSVLSESVNTFGMVREPHKDPYNLAIVVTAQGICFKTLVHGFWFLPFSDIDAYLEKHAAVAEIQ